MNDTSSVLALCQSLHDITSAEWNRHASTSQPFVSHEFLSLLEQSGTVGGTTGWQPLHAVLREKHGRIMAVAPLYGKTHSQGEYVFDHGWADGFMRAGGQYYPKLQCAVPFTPVPGPRLLAGGNAEARRALADALFSLPQQLDLSSLHVTFCTEEESAILAEAGFLIRWGLQYHWRNEAYRGFVDFLAALSSRKRKMIRKERQQVADAGITHRWLTGRDITEAHLDHMFRFYQDTGDRKWGQPYLNREFFHLLGETMADKVLLVFAERDGMPIAGALNLIGESALYGRYWGCDEAYKFLHFETCYYQAIDYAIAHGLHRVEAGAQGEHKVLRGYRPVLTYSAHAIVHEGFREAVEQFLTHERQAILEERAALDAISPFRRED